MAFFGQNIVRDSSTLVFHICSTVYKIPLTASARRELREERTAILKALGDVHFATHVPAYRGTFLLKMPLYRSFKIEEHEGLMREYFRTAFSDAASWTTSSLQDVISLSSLLKFLNTHTSDVYWKETLFIKKVPESSMHGDFFPENILVNGNRLYFIDWARYARRGSRYFDLIDYFIFSQKSSLPWFDFWLSMSVDFPKVLFSIALPQDAFFAYALWKISEELKTLYLRQHLTTYKVKKYRENLAKLKSYGETYIGE